MLPLDPKPWKAGRKLADCTGRSSRKCVILFASLLLWGDHEPVNHRNHTNPREIFHHTNLCQKHTWPLAHFQRALNWHSLWSPAVSLKREWESSGWDERRAGFNAACPPSVLMHADGWRKRVGPKWSTGKHDSIRQAENRSILGI